MCYGVVKNVVDCVPDFNEVVNGHNNRVVMD